MIVTPRRSYFLHRWLGAIVGLQLLAWTLGGLVFSSYDLRRVHGDLTRRASPPEAIPLKRVRIDPTVAAHSAGIAQATAVELKVLIGRPVFEVRSAGGAKLVDAESGTLRTIDRALAEQIARADQRGTEVSSIDLIARDPDIEYREQPLPAWRISFADGEGTRVYVDASTGAVRARRNDAWRRYDFFWMLHTMDYSGRDDFHHPWLVAFAGLAFTLSLTGFLLWGFRIRRKWR